ncbi:MAG TPA: hypothetical protein VI796_01535 [Candidatus Thermoplasmatota archaeon]|nr:hypothetical protein [Candidatus Thermoplasmatota archaeon]
MDWQGKPVPLAADGLPEPLTWRPVFQLKALLLGVLLDLAIEVLLQQMGRQPFTGASLVRAALVGIALGVAVPSLGRLLGVVWANRAIRKARAGNSRGTAGGEGRP